MVYHIATKLAQRGLLRDKVTSIPLQTSELNSDERNCWELNFMGCRMFLMVQTLRFHEEHTLNSLSFSHIHTTSQQTYEAVHALTFSHWLPSYSSAHNILNRSLSVRNPHGAHAGDWDIFMTIPYHTESDTLKFNMRRNLERAGTWRGHQIDTRTWYILGLLQGNIRRRFSYCPDSVILKLRGKLRHTRGWERRRGGWGGYWILWRLLKIFDVHNRGVFWGQGMQFLQFFRLLSQELLGSGNWRVAIATVSWKRPATEKMMYYCMEEKLL